MAAKKRKTKTKRPAKATKTARKAPGKKIAKSRIKKSKTKKTAKKAKTSGQLQAMTLINEKLSHLEKQALKAYECVQAIRKRSTPDWKTWIEKLSPQDWAALADAQRERVSLEIKHLSDEILTRIHHADVLKGKNKILKQAKSNLEGIIKSVDHSDLIEKAIDTAIHTKDGLLAFLNIPTHDEMTQLQRKLKRLERRMGQLSGNTRKRV